MATSPQAKAVFVDDRYQKLFGGPPTNGEENHYLALYAGGQPQETVLADMAGSEAFYSHVTT